MKTKQQRAADGPGWIEVILGALLSVMVGIVLSAVFLIFKPVTTAKELPKEPVANTVYFLEGTRDSSKTRELASKRKLLAEGGAVAFNEDELNTIAIPPVAAPVAKKMELPQPVAAKKTITPGTPNFRIRNSVMQIGVPVQLSAFDMDYGIVVQARGGFSQVGDAVVYQPAEVYVGSCPLGRLPIVRDFFLKQIVGDLKISDEMLTGWRNIAAASVEGSALHLTAR